MKTCIPARSVEDFRELMETDPKEVDFIRSMEDWKEFCRNADSQKNPLQPLSEEEVREFTKFLVFNGGGIAGARVDEIQEKLSYRQYRVLMEAFGMDLVFAADHEGYKCEGTGTCKKAIGYICTSNC